MPVTTFLDAHEQARLRLGEPTLPGNLPQLINEVRERTGEWWLLERVVSVESIWWTFTTERVEHVRLYKALTLGGMECQMITAVGDAKTANAYLLGLLSGLEELT